MMFVWYCSVKRTSLHLSYRLMSYFQRLFLLGKTSLENAGFTWDTFYKVLDSLFYSYGFWAGLGRAMSE